MRRIALPFYGLTGLVLILITACGGAAPAPTATSAPPATPAPTATTAPAATTPPTTGNGGGELDGQAIFTGAGGCGACHIVEGISIGQVGPDLTHIGTDAASRKPGMSAEEYIIESIRMPDAFVPEGVERAIPGLMVPALTANLSDADIDALVEFLLAQK